MSKHTDIKSILIIGQGRHAASLGQHDSYYLFERFVAHMGTQKGHAA